MKKRGEQLMKQWSYVLRPCAILLLRSVNPLKRKVLPCDLLFANTAAGVEVHLGASTVSFPESALHQS